MVNCKTPSYYRAKDIDPFSILPFLYELNNIQDPYIAFLYGNIVKYIWRLGAKGQTLSDIDKAIVYLYELRDKMEAELDG